MAITADGQGSEHPRHDRETPTGGDDDPTRFFSLCLAQYDIRHDTIAKQHHDHRSEKFAEKCRMHAIPFAIFLTVRRSFYCSYSVQSSERPTAFCQLPNRAARRFSAICGCQRLSTAQLLTRSSRLRQ